MKAETRATVFAKAGVLSARELTRLVEECSALAKEKLTLNWLKVWVVKDLCRRPRWKTRHRKRSLGSDFRREKLRKRRLVGRSLAAGCGAPLCRNWSAGAVLFLGAFFECGSGQISCASSWVERRRDKCWPGWVILFCMVA